ncbi:4-oxalocrotonate tautomerase family protein [Maritalea porphyrae]|mgnify:CR=1 FL=1|jgi:4-oxalocrotonate tautomerase|uniref:tautomerase family protein n=1 Tax=Maritalea porphyrae TaxID=880732 RepID=UPI0022AEBEB0|nr:4-oxalocrotonate tautomerase family protein [Maritalea porphyrae]MCZ4273947.1 4-oxalocrotonate tautomerase family protein [Maritalea porphyrae]
MPLIDINVIEGVFTPKQKQELITNVTDAVVAIEGENLRSVTWVRILEVKSGDWAIGGQMLQSGDVQDMARGTG